MWSWHERITTSIQKDAAIQYLYLLFPFWGLRKRRPTGNPTQRCLFYLPLGDITEGSLRDLQVALFGDKVSDDIYKEISQNVSRFCRCSSCFERCLPLASWQLHIHLATFPSWDSPGSQMSHPKMVSRCSVWNGSEIRHVFWTAGVSQVISVWAPAGSIPGPSHIARARSDLCIRTMIDEKLLRIPDLYYDHGWPFLEPVFPTSCGGEPKIRVAELAASWVRAGGIILVQACPNSRRAIFFNRSIEKEGKISSDLKQHFPS